MITPSKYFKAGNAVPMQIISALNYGSWAIGFGLRDWGNSPFKFSIASNEFKFQWRDYKMTDFWRHLSEMNYFNEGYLVPTNELTKRGFYVRLSDESLILPLKGQKKVIGRAKNYPNGFVGFTTKSFSTKNTIIGDFTNMMDIASYANSWFDANVCLSSSGNQFRMCFDKATPENIYQRMYEFQNQFFTAGTIKFNKDFIYLDMQ